MTDDRTPAEVEADEHDRDVRAAFAAGRAAHDAFAAEVDGQADAFAFAGVVTREGGPRVVNVLDLPPDAPDTEANRKRLGVAVLNLYYGIANPGDPRPDAELDAAADLLREASDASEDADVRVAINSVVRIVERIAAGYRRQP